MTKNYHVITVKYIAPTDYRPSRVKMISERFNQSFVFNYDYDGNTLEQAEAKAAKLGFNLIGSAEGRDCYYIITDTFKPFQDESEEETK